MAPMFTDSTRIVQATAGARRGNHNQAPIAAQA